MADSIIGKLYKNLLLENRTNPPFQNFVCLFDYEKQDPEQTENFKNIAKMIASTGGQVFDIHEIDSEAGRNHEQFGQISCILSLNFKKSLNKEPRSPLFEKLDDLKLEELTVYNSTIFIPSLIKKGILTFVAEKLYEPAIIWSKNEHYNFWQNFSLNSPNQNSTKNSKTLDSGKIFNRSIKRNSRRIKSQDLDHSIDDTSYISDLSKPRAKKIKVSDASFRNSLEGTSNEDASEIKPKKQANSYSNDMSRIASLVLDDSENTHQLSQNVDSPEGMQLIKQLKNLDLPNHCMTPKTNNVEGGTSPSGSVIASREIDSRSFISDQKYKKLGYTRHDFIKERVSMLIRKYRPANDKLIPKEVHVLLHACTKFVFHVSLVCCFSGHFSEIHSKNGLKNSPKMV